ncbi:MAG: glycoside hydrolase family 1 protein [Promethearchaeati archaeon SRVP18_Atabeyarchaeia-1]
MTTKSAGKSLLEFPKGFLWGSAISAYQAEGGNTNQWSVWEQEGGHIKDGSVCGKADDFYHLYEEDIDLARKLGHKVFRFSIEWSRIEPREGDWNKKEVEHYRKVIMAIRKRGMEPFVTLHHFTNPVWMEKEGAWVNARSVDHFTRYTAYLVRELGDLVDLWGPINEPTAYAAASYMLGKFPPCESDLSKYQAVLRNMLLGHANAYHTIHDALGRNKAEGAPKVGTVKDTECFQPYNEKSQKDRDEAGFLHQFYNASFLDALKTGKINPPIGSGELIDAVKGALDFIGFNYYSRMLVRAGAREVLQEDKPLTRKDSLGITDMGYEIYPEGIYQIIKWLTGYNLPIYVTENGVAVKDDARRSMSIVLHLEQVHRAIREGANVQAYFYWSLLDNFEWDSGYDKRFGIVEVDYRTLERKPRPSAYLYKEIIERNGITGEMLTKYRRAAADKTGRS